MCWPPCKACLVVTAPIPHNPLSGSSCQAQAGHFPKCQSCNGKASVVSWNSFRSFSHPWEASSLLFRPRVFEQRSKLSLHWWIGFWWRQRSYEKELEMRFRSVKTLGQSQLTWPHCRWREESSEWIHRQRPSVPSPDILIQIKTRWSLLFILGFWNKYCAMLFTWYLSARLRMS